MAFQAVQLSSHLVLVVDDDASVRSALERLLRSLGLHAESFASASEALGCDHLSRVDCFILDIHLPDLSGWELSEELIARGAGSPVIFITADIDQIRPRGPGKQPTVLRKPFDAEQLVLALRGVPALAADLDD